jgi:hypothetical protein
MIPALSYKSGSSTGFVIFLTLLLLLFMSIMVKSTISKGQEPKCQKIVLTL